MEKRIIIIEPDGTEKPVTETVTPDFVSGIIGGPIEIVRVLRQSVKDRYIYDVMIANEQGLLSGLPRNQKATEIYLANIKRRYPDVENPHKAADEAWRKQFPEGTQFVSLAPEGYGDDPYIAGTVIWFDGYEVEEVDQMMYPERDF